jgi:hypothetical protein
VKLKFDRIFQKLAKLVEFALEKFLFFKISLMFVEKRNNGDIHVLESNRLIIGLMWQTGFGCSG